MLHRQVHSQVKPLRPVNLESSQKCGRPAKTHIPRILHRVQKNESDRVIRDFLEALGTPRALAVWLLFVNNEHEQLIRYSINPSDYLDSDKCVSRFIPKYTSTHSEQLPKGVTRFRLDYAASRFLS